MSILFSTISNVITHELDLEKMAKQLWNSLKVKNQGVTHIRKARVQSLKRDYENLFMDEYELILDFFGKLSCIVNEIRSRGGRISDAEVASKLLIHVSSMSTL